MKAFLLVCLIVIMVNCQDEMDDYHPADSNSLDNTVYDSGSAKLLGLGQGDCNEDWDCERGLMCGKNSCEGTSNGPDCCIKPPLGHRDYCSVKYNLCDKGEGDCSRRRPNCKPGLVCGEDNCVGKPFSSGDDCCKVANISAPKWKPVVKFHLGKLSTQSSTQFPLPSHIPTYAIELLLYVKIKSVNSKANDSMSYRIYSEENSVQYSKYFPAWHSNAANIWLPYTSQRQVHVQATDFPRPLPSDVSADIYVIGYRNTWK